MNKIVCIKLITGEELVGQMEYHPGTDGSIIYIKEPVCFVPIDEQRTACIKYMPISEDRNFEFKEQHVICICERLPSQVVNMYNEKYGNGIVTASIIPNISSALKLAA